MLDFKDPETFYFFLRFVVPGLVIVYVRSTFISGKRPSHTENMLSYVVLSLVYYAAVLPIYEFGPSTQATWLPKAAAWISLTLIGPALFGLFLGAWAQRDWGVWIAGKLGLNTVHVIPAAWDWRFSRNPKRGLFVMVTLTSGERVAGYYGSGSFASSDVAERDIYIEEEYTVDDESWTARPAKIGILVPFKEIRYVEFWEA